MLTYTYPFRTSEKAVRVSNFNAFSKSQNKKKKTKNKQPLFARKTNESNINSFAMPFVISLEKKVFHTEDLTLNEVRYWLSVSVNIWHLKNLYFSISDNFYLKTACYKTKNEHCTVYCKTYRNVCKVNFYTVCTLNSVTEHVGFDRPGRTTAYISELYAYKKTRSERNVCRVWK